MSRLAFLSPRERQQFDSPPVFDKEQRPAYFVITDDVRRQLNSLRTNTNKVCFLLQLGYFKSSGKFFVPTQYRQRDINYVKRVLNVSDDITVADYKSPRCTQHRLRILELSQWQSYDGQKKTLIAQHIRLLTQQQLKPEEIFSAATEFCWQHRIEIPTYHQLSLIITDSFNLVEAQLLEDLKSSLDETTSHSLDALLALPDNHWRPLVTQFKRNHLSLRTNDIRQTVDTCQSMAELFLKSHSVIESMDLPDQAVQYYAAWVQKAKLSQLKQFPNRFKRYAYLLAFTKHRHFYNQDTLLDIFLKSVRTATNATYKQLSKADKLKRQERHHAIQSINQSHKTARCLLEEITRIVRSDMPSAAEKIEKIDVLLNEHDALQNTALTETLEHYEQVIDQQMNELTYYDVLETQSLRLQRKVASVLYSLSFDAGSSIEPLFTAITHFQETQGYIGHTPPMGFCRTKSSRLFMEKALFASHCIKYCFSKLQPTRYGPVNSICGIRTGTVPYRITLFPKTDGMLNVHSYYASPVWTCSQTVEPS